MAKTNIFLESAKSALSLSPVMEGREKLDTEDLLGDERLTIDEFDIVSLDGKQFGVCHFVEYPNNYYNGGAILTKLFQNWADLFNGEIETASKNLKGSGGVPIRLSAARTKKGNNLTAVTVLYD